jgi:hypothetical protein
MEYVTRRSNQVLSFTLIRDLNYNIVGYIRALSSVAEIIQLPAAGMLALLLC